MVSDIRWNYYLTVKFGSLDNVNNRAKLSYTPALNQTTRKPLEVNVTIKVGDKMPEGVFKIMRDDGPGAMSSKEIFSGKKVVLFSVPGAFTPTCSKQHLPGYIEKADEFKSKGVDTIACMAVNDVFVMGAWADQSGAGDKVLLLADGNAEYANALGLALDASGHGMGTRGQRFAMVVDDGVLTQLHVEAGGEFKVSAADYILENL